MPANVRETGLNTRDAETVKQTSEFYNELNNKAKKNAYPLPASGKRPAKVYDAAFYYDQLLLHLNNINDEAKTMAEDKFGVSAKNIHNFSKYNGYAVEDIDRILELEKNPDAPENKARIEFVKNLRATLVKNHDAGSKLYEKIEAENEKAILGDTMKVYNDANPFAGENFNNFVGPKYLTMEARAQKAEGMAYTVDRAGPLSISMLALINEGMDFDTLTDPKKGLDRKQAMYDKVSTLIRTGGEEAQQWIAKNLYEGQKNIEKMISDEAKKFDYTRTDLLEDKKFCQLLHLNHTQFDSWQEMAGCKKQIVAIANKEHPEIDNYEKLKDHFRDRQCPLLGLRNCISKTRNICAGLVDEHDPVVLASETKTAVNYCLFNKLNIKTIGNAIQRNTDPNKLLVDMFTPEEIMLDQFVSMGLQSLKYMDSDPIFKEPGLSLPMAKSIISGEFTKNMNFEGEMMKPKVVGAPTHDDIQAMLIKNSRSKDLEAVTDSLGNVDKNIENAKPKTAMEQKAIDYMKTSANKFEGLVKATVDADAAVHNSSGVFKDAAKSLKALDKAMKAYEAEQNVAKRLEMIKKMEKLKEDAETKVQKYLDRKEKNKPRNGNYEQKTQDRIDLMNLALKEVKDFRYNIDDMRLDTETRAVRATSQVMNDHDEVFRSEYTEKIDGLIATEKKANVKTFYKSVKDAYNRLDVIATAESDQPLTNEQIASIKNDMATIAFREMLTDVKSGKLVKNSLSKNAKDVKASIDKLEGSQEFSDNIRNLFNDAGNLDRGRLKEILSSPDKFSKNIVASKLSAKATAAIKQKKMPKTGNNNGFKNELNKKLSSQVKK